ncbi:SPX domain-containing membrane protein At4g11810 [Hondaea fermentalgiana]|uniref:SPX domain-containing membrane protein At4g11810 n=1 Tax=Hondaea fermentalgiana TaxID=2315210 RepID=A0A2R5GIH1_9STRA|nr:SPX domain-containing membrane protein At4g11810 [Hondaea fermentalgiana]|eukprot:GBG30395.1 SPX domain-containing membrane protein At4g11810 [Hondaea fermentalgiana]
MTREHVVPLLDGDNERDEQAEDGDDENEEHKRRRKIGLFSLTSATVVAVGCLGMIEYSMVMPSLAHYVRELGQTNVFYGVCQAAFSLSRLIFMPVLGRWSDKRPMIEPFLFSIVLAAIGNALYGLAFGLRTAWLILFARILVGMGSANATLTMSFVARITEKETRTKAMAILNGLNLIGVVLGPATNLLITDVDFQLNSVMVFNGLTNPGWVMVVLLAGLVVLTLATFREPPRLSETDVAYVSPSFAPPSENSSPAVSLRRPSVISILSDETTEPMLDTPMLHRQARASALSVRGLVNNIIRHNLWMHFVISFCGNFVINELDTALPALTEHDFGWDAIANSYVYAGLGLAVALSLIVVIATSRFVSDRSLIGTGLSFMLTGVILSIAYCRHKPAMLMFVICVFLQGCAAPIVGSPNMSLFSKRLEEDENLAVNMGLYIGLLQGTNGLSRVVAPLYAGFALLDLEDHLHVYIGPLIVVVLALVVFCVNYDAVRERSLV